MKKKQQQRVEAALSNTQDLRLQASTNLPLTGFNGALQSAGKVFAAGAVLCASLVSPTAFASTLYAQSPSGQQYTNMPSSTSDGWLNDHFVATQSGTVSNITWQGNAQPNLNSGFTISIIPGLVSGKPYTPVLPELSNVTPLMTVTGNAGQTIGPLGGNTLPLYYNFNMDLTTPFNLVKGTSYWINIEFNGSAWVWANGTGGSFNIEYCTANYTCAPGVADRAFSLNGTLDTVVPPPAAVPLPGAVWLFGIGLVGFQFLSHRKKTA